MRTRNLNAEIFGLRLGLNAPWTSAEIAAWPPAAGTLGGQAAVESGPGEGGLSSVIIPSAEEQGCPVVV